MPIFFRRGRCMIAFQLTGGSASRFVRTASGAKRETNYMKKIRRYSAICVGFLALCCAPQCTSEEIELNETEAPGLDAQDESEDEGVFFRGANTFHRNCGIQEGGCILSCLQGGNAFGTGFDLSEGRCAGAAASAREPLTNQPTAMVRDFPAPETTVPTPQRQSARLRSQRDR